MTHLHIRACVPGVYRRGSPGGVFIEATFRIELDDIAPDEAPVALTVPACPFGNGMTSCDPYGLPVPQGVTLRRHHAGAFWAPFVEEAGGPMTVEAFNAWFAKANRRLNTGLLGLPSNRDHKDSMSVLLGKVRPETRARLPADPVEICTEFGDLMQARLAVIGGIVHYASGEPVLAAVAPFGGKRRVGVRDGHPTSEGSDATCFRIDGGDSITAFLSSLPDNPFFRRAVLPPPMDISEPAAFLRDDSVAFPVDALSGFGAFLETFPTGLLPPGCLSALAGFLDHAGEDVLRARLAGPLPFDRLQGAFSCWELAVARLDDAGSLPGAGERSVRDKAISSFREASLLPLARWRHMADVPALTAIDARDAQALSDL